ncbi:MAG: Crp/Fnr family transcriptional regulator [Eubacteriales bacterium]
MTEMKMDECPFMRNGSVCTAQIRLFKAFPESSQVELREAAVHRRYERDTVLFEEGAEIQNIIVIRKGSVKLCRFEASGDEYVLDILHEGQAVWHDIFLKDYTYHYSGICLTDLEVCLISRQKFMDIIRTEPEAAVSLIAMLNTELTEAKEKAMLLSIREPEVRVAGFLLSQDERNCGKGIHMKLEDIASSIGLRPETVSRNISRLREKGLVRRVGRGILQVTDRPSLQQLFRSGAES